MIRYPAIALLAALATPSSAAVIGQSPHGFEVKHDVVVPLDAGGTWKRLLAIGTWWSDDHTFSGKAANLAIEPKAGGCFCETWAQGSVQHMRVSYIANGQRLVLNGPLGPLMFEGVAGMMDLRLVPAGAQTKVTMIYRAGGFARANGTDMAPLVDRVLGEQMDRLAKP